MRSCVGFLHREKDVEDMSTIRIYYTEDLLDDDSAKDLQELPQEVRTNTDERIAFSTPQARHWLATGEVLPEENL